MSELESNLTTFQNLCVIACADGKIGEGAMALLADMALSMGLPPGEFWAKILRAPFLDFIIPDTEEERLKELRMVILMMISDGQITPTEYKGCQFFAEKLDIPKDYLDEIIEYFRSKQEERLKKMAIYGNLYIMAAADEEVSEEETIFLENAAESLGLNEDEIEHIHSNYQNMELVVPEGEEERYYALRNIVFMMLIDGEIDKAEYTKCVQYAQLADLDQQAVDSIITEYRQKADAYKEPPADLDIENIDIYLDVYNAFNRIEFAPKFVAKTIIDMLARQNFTHKAMPQKINTKAFYDFLWLLCVRAISLDEGFSEKLPQKLKEILSTNSFRQLQADLLDIEQTYGESSIQLPRFSLREVKEAISDFYRE